MIRNISHITFIVKDLEKATQFFSSIFDAREIYDSKEKQFSLSQEKFFLIGDLWICIMEGNSLLEQTYNHIAFYVSDGELDMYLERIKSLGVEIRPERPRVKGEGRSIYFYDYDNHLFELHSGTLEERLNRYNK
ncbi:MAG: FosX/FosE/FosI family fosfomycin resistance hydrolase [Coprobacillaceae bacterium]